MTQMRGQLASRNRWPIYASYAAASGMIICFSVLFIQLLVWLFPGFITTGILFVCALVVLEAFFSFWLVKRLPTAQRQIAYYRVTEMVILLMALKLFTEFRNGPIGFWQNFLLWPVEFPLNIITGQFLLIILPVLSAWWAGNLFAGDLALLEEEDPSLLDSRYKTTPIRIVIFKRFISLGVVAVILAGIPAQNIFQVSLPTASKGAAVVILFFVFGIILLSLTRYITLETNWRQASLEIPAQIPRRWFAYSGLILVILIFLVGWLPTNYEMGLLETLNAIFHLIYQFVLLVYAAILVIISLVARLLFRNSPESQAIISDITPPAEPLPPANAPSAAWELVKSILLWGGLIALSIVALRQYIAYNQSLSKELQKFSPLRWLISAWYRFIASFKKANSSVGKFIQNSLMRLRNSGTKTYEGGEWDFINPHRLTHRQKIIFYYLALVRRAREAGIPRRDDQTPYEYAQSLSFNLKEEKKSVDAMTASFMEARYSRHDIPAGEVSRTETIWEAIRKALRKIRISNIEDKSKDNG